MASAALQRGNYVSGEMMKYVKQAGLVLLVLLLLSAGGFVVWAENGYGPAPAAVLALESDAAVSVTDTGAWREFMPVSGASTGLVLYPGARVDPRAYAEAAHGIAAQGYAVVVLDVPLNLAIFSPNRAAAVIAAHPEIRHWAVGGHSLGGSAAAIFASANASALDGIVFWASYPAVKDRLADTSLKMLTIYGEHDGLVTAAMREQVRPLFPATASWVIIAGGNHAQFGDYGAQSGDQPATITVADQQQQIIRTTADFLGQLAP